MYRRRALCLLALLVASGPGRAQAELYELGLSAANNDDFGYSVGDAGDVNGDGFLDVIVGSPFADTTNGTSSGKVEVFSGRDGSLIFSIAGENPSDAFGWSVDGIGDITGDGLSDIIVSAPLFDFFSLNGGKIYVFSGATQGTLFTAMVNQSAAQIGSVVRGLGDITGDGIPDFAYGSQFFDEIGSGLTDNGRLDVYSGSPGLPNLFVRYGNESGARYGASVDVVRATPLQSTSRILVGAPGDDGFGVDVGEAYLLNGFGNLISAFQGGTSNSFFGTSVAGLGDVNLDGFPDYAISAPYVDILFVGVDAGQVTVYSGATTSALFSVSGPAGGARYGQSLAGFGDMNGDGRNDVLIGAPNHDAVAVDSGEVVVASGAGGGVILASYTAGLNDHAGAPSARRAT